ncbi:MAG: methylmalonyl-CoA decarboxylase [Pseudomonadota bacterium]
MDANPAAFGQMVEQFGVITMNRSQRLNCLSRELVDAVLATLDELAAAGARAVILRAQRGAKVWSAGHDIQEIPLDGSDPVSWNVPFEVLLRRVRDYPAPVIGLIEGSVWGGACDLAVSLDMLVGAPTASFAITPAKLGLPYNAAGLTHFLGVLPLHVAKEMLYTSQPLSAEDAYRLGLLNRLVPAEELEAAAYGLARDVAARAPLAIRVLKAEMRNLTRGPALAAEDFEDVQSLRQEAFRSQDFQEGIAAFFQKRGPVFKGE